MTPSTVYVIKNYLIKHMSAVMYPHERIRVIYKPVIILSYVARDLYNER